MNFPQIKESSELSRLKALADNDLDSTCGFVQGGTDEFSKNNTDQENNTITFSLYNPTTSPLDVQLYGFDPANFSTVATNPPPTIQNGPFNVPGVGGGNASQSSFCPTNNCLYISYTADAIIQVFNCITNTIVTTIAVPGTSGNPPCYCPVNNQMYCQNALGALLRIDCNTNTIVGVPIILPSLFDNAQSIVYNSVKNSIYGVLVVVPPSFIAEISCTTNLVVAVFSSIFFPPGFDIGPMCFNPLLNKIYINDNTLGLLHILDCATNTFPFPIALPIIPNSSYQANLYCPFNNSVYVTSSATNQYVQVNCATLVVSPPIATLMVLTVSLTMLA